MDIFCGEQTRSSAPSRFRRNKLLLLLVYPPLRRVHPLNCAAATSSAKVAWPA